MAFIITKNVHVERDKDGIVRHLRHQIEPYTSDSAGLREPTPLMLASSYVKEVAPIYSIPEKMLTELDIQPPRDLTNAQDWNTKQSTLLQFAGQKSIFESKTISYFQTIIGLPIWEAGLSVSLLGNPLRVASSVNTVHLEVQLVVPDSNASFLPKKITTSELIQLLGINEKELKKTPEINSMRLLIYRYDPERRFDPESEMQKREGGRAGPPILPLPTVPDTVKPFKHYVVTEVMFRLGVGGQSPIN